MKVSDRYSIDVNSSLCCPYVLSTIYQLNNCMHKSIYTITIIDPHYYHFIYVSIYIFIYNSCSWYFICLYIYIYCWFNFDALAQRNAYKPTKEPVGYHGPSGDRIQLLQTEATPPAASCPARSFHATEIVSKTQFQWHVRGGTGQLISRFEFTSVNFNTKYLYVQSNELGMKLV